MSDDTTQEPKSSALKLSLPLAVVCSLLAGAALGGVSVGMKTAHLEEKIESTRKLADDTKAEVSDLNRVLQDTVVNRAVVETKLNSIEKALERIENRLGTK